MSTASAEPTKRNQSAKAERLKREKNPWECLEEIRCVRAPGDLPPFLKPGSRPISAGGAFTPRVTAPEFWAARTVKAKLCLTSCCVSVCRMDFLLRASFMRSPTLSEKYARGSADITVRQNIQLHWIAIEDLADVLQTLFDVGLTSMATCGDVPRNRHRLPTRRA